jgi:hypothetical protein
MAKESNDQYGAKETKQRTQTILRGAFAGPPTPLDAIPKKNGESRKKAQRKASSASVSSAKTSERRS